MRITSKLYLSAAPIALAGVLAGVPSQLSAQLAPPAESGARPPRRASFAGAAVSKR